MSLCDFVAAYETLWANGFVFNGVVCAIKLQLKYFKILYFASIYEPESKYKLLGIY